MKNVTPPPKPPIPPNRPPQPPPKFHVKAHDGVIVMSPRIQLDPVETTGKSIAILGTNGSGKSGTSRQFMEEQIEKGLPFAIADIENEFATLKELGDVLLAGTPSDYGEIKLDVPLINSGEFYEIGRKAYEDSRSVILLLGELDDDTRKLYLKSFIDGIFEAANNPKTAHRYTLILEEVQEYIPQTGLAKSDELRQTIIRFGKRGRKRKLSLVLVSQRPSNVDKDVLTQCHIFFFHFVTYSTDLDLYQNSFGIDNARERCQNMKPGDVIFMFGKQIIDDHITRPKTISPWDIGAKFDVSTFVASEDVQEIKAEVEREGKKDEGMSVIKTADLKKLETEVKKLTEEHQAFIDLQIQHEQEIEALKARPMVASTGNFSKDAQAVIADLKQELGKAQAQAFGFRTFASLIKEHDNG